MRPRNAHQHVLDVLAEAGRMTRLELQLATGISRQHICELLRDLQGAPPRDNAGHMRPYALPRQVRITDWVRDNAGGAGRFYLRAVYGLGVGPDAKHPGALSSSQCERRRREKRSFGRRVAKTVPNSIFNWRPE